jgi:beta-mannosidase
VPDLRRLSLDGDDWTLYWLLPNEWFWRRVWETAPPEAAARRLPASVPGHVQEALLRAEALPHPYVREHSRQWEWTSARDWVYEKPFSVPEELAGDRYLLRFEGLDDAGHVYLNGRRVGDHEGQFLPAEWDVTDHLRADRPNHLVVVVERAPDVQGQIGRTSRERRWKSRFAYGWDWATRLPPVGIWDSVWLQAVSQAWFRGVSVNANLSTDRSEASLAVISEFGARERTQAVIRLEVTQQGLPVATVEDPITLFESDTSLVQSTIIPRIQLWWPNGSGRPALYQARVTLMDAREGVLDQREIEFGVRELELQPCEGAPPDSLPYVLTVNGRRTWIKGWNWTPLDHLYGSLDEARYRPFLELARDAGVNLLRVWGGGLLEKEAFYRLCDRYGILVWQEFPLSSSGIDNTPSEDPGYLNYIRMQAEGMLERRRNHPSLAIWCGGNELTDDRMRPLGSDHPALAELREAVLTEDPQRLWLPTSPSGPVFDARPEARGQLHDAHGPWLWLGPAEHPRFYNRIDPLLHSEFGCEGAADVETLRFIFDGPPSPPDLTDPVWLHHGGAWWLRPETVAAAFGPTSDAASFVRASQALQAMGLQYAVEAARRRKWRCAGTLPWQFNEAWPNAICTSAVDYFGRPKAAYYAVKRAYAGFHVSASFDSFTWQGRPRFEAEVWLHNSGEERSLLNVVATLCDLNGREWYQENLAGEAPANSAENVGDLSWRFPGDFQGPFLLLLEVIDEEGDTLARNAYWHSCAPEPPFAGFLEAPATALEVRHEGNRLRIANLGPALALGVTVFGEGVRSSDSDFPMLPGDVRELSVAPEDARPTVRAWNLRNETGPNEPAPAEDDRR